VVTGSSSGIGRAIALELATGGADVLIHARQRRDAACRVADQVRALGRRSHVVILDLADAANHAPLVQQAWQWGSEVDIWVNNAGVDVLTGPLADKSFSDKLEQLWRVDVSATIQISRLAGQRMQAGSGRRGIPVILNVGWDQAEIGMEGDSGEMFAAVKAAVMAFTRSLAKSLAPQVRVNCIAPGWIRTSWGEQASQYWQHRARQESLLQRWGTPEDVARVARFLASPAAEFITGQIVAVNGGYR
jgi:3-oxoacyl-[acyl-carrier protein] reductase